MSAENTNTVPPPPPPLKTNKEYSLQTGTPDTGLLLVDIRNGVTLKPTKTRDKSTAAFIKKSNAPLNDEVSQPNGYNNEAAIDEKKNALQQELRNTLRRKVKKQDVECGDPTKNQEIEKKIEVKRTDVELKINNTGSDTGNSTSQLPPPKPARSFNGNSETAEIVKSPVLKKISTNRIEAPSIVSNNTSIKTEPKVNIEPFGKSITLHTGTLKKVNPQKELKIDVTVAQADSLKSSILSPEVKSGNAAIRPSQIKTLTKQGSHVSHTDIVEDTKTFKKSPVKLVEEIPAANNTPAPTSTKSEAFRTIQIATKPPSRTTILDTKVPNNTIKPVTSPKATSNEPSKKLLISHPKASFTLPRSNSRKTKQSEPTGSKPVFRILTELEQAEQRYEKNKSSPNPRADSPGVEPVLNSYVSFAKELANAPNNYPDTVPKTKTVGTLQEDLFYGNTNLRDIKIDIVENGQFKVVSK